MPPRHESRPEPNKTDLLAEARLLRQLLRAYRTDRDFLKQDSQNRLVVFLDSTEVVSYVDPESPGGLSGFLLVVESLQDEDRRRKVALRHDQILNGLLFDPAQTSGMFTSHVEEMEQEVEFLERRFFDRVLHLIDQARREIRKESEKATRFARAAQADPAVRGELVSFMRKHAPDLTAILQDNLSSAFKRMHAVLKDSELALFDTMPWQSFGVPDHVAAQLLALEPTANQVVEQRTRLRNFDFRRNSLEANFVDAKALAQLHLVRAALEAHGLRHLRVVLVTRASTLLRAAATLARESGEPLAVRHPRLLALSQEQAATLDEAADLTLSTAADLWQSTIRALPEDGIDVASVRIQSESFIQAWDSFESSRLAAETRWRNGLFGTDQASADSRLAQQFIDLFCGVNPEEELKRLVIDEFVALGSASSELLLAGEPLRMQASIMPNPERGRLIVTPLSAPPAGPIQVAANAGLSTLGDHSALSDIARLVERKSEQPLVWALSLACAGKWHHAAIFADSALKLAELERSAETVDEALLLRAEIRRLGTIPANDANADAVQDRERVTVADSFAESAKDLGRVSRRNAARVHREAAAQLLEAALRETVSEDLAERLRSLFRLLDADADAMTSQSERARCLAMMLMLALYDRRYLAQSPSLAHRDEDRIRKRHGDLVATMNELGRHGLLEAVPLRARAMELIGYLLIEERHRPPHAGRDELTHLQRVLRASTDRVGRMLENEIEQIRLRFAETHAPELSLVPIPLVGDIRPAEATDALLAECVDQVDRIGWQVFDAGPNVESDLKLEQVIADLTKYVGSSQRDRPHSDFVLRSGLLYARLLEATMEPRHVQRQRFTTLMQDYRQFHADYPDDLIPLIRLAFVAEHLDDTPALQEALTEAMRLIEPACGDRAPQHGPAWLQSLVRRRYGVLVVLPQDGNAERRWDKPLTDPAARLQAEALVEVCQHLMTAEIQDRGEAIDQGHIRERDRRNNNVVFYGSRLLERVGQAAYDRVPELKRLDDYATRLVPSLETEKSLPVLHTLGCYFNVTNQSDRLSRVTRRMMEVGATGDPLMTSLNVASLDEFAGWLKAELGQPVA